MNVKINLNDFMYESRHQKPISFHKFVYRLINHIFIAFLVVMFSLGIGMIGFHMLVHLSWIDSFINASMLLSGMGPVDIPKTYSGKLFAGLYALYSGIIFLVVIGIITAPIIHRLLHKFHWEEK